MDTHAEEQPRLHTLASKMEEGRIGDPLTIGNTCHAVLHTFPATGVKVAIVTVNVLLSQFTKIFHVK